MEATSGHHPPPEPPSARGPGLGEHCHRVDDCRVDDCRRASGPEWPGQAEMPPTTDLESDHRRCAAVGDLDAALAES